mmetsp:Transcript_119262/g.344969  ORF Transcript_119262/g.344969 Transcript_119262/m.344969 type:complete len:170 (+) Transcript_119262:84-593(+)|eukprot:CAMPEP_0176026436 /NCGR_PEP_ID=MMETSP0120_2-20121206/12950_1 /TAXON_ID=160619 /ORGANISM="Kryptoperidinium foliaceum, Strain CCMP 1326" /LENGTH=169 /DNA_ID=CAMNT_0017359633 /DNA_START=64 /DNA_END=573 /DNA_ORIENTATION=-
MTVESAVKHMSMAPAAAPSASFTMQVGTKRKCSDEAQETIKRCRHAALELTHFLEVHPKGPLDFGARLLEYVWSFRLVYSAPIEFLMLLYSQGGPEECKQQNLARKVVAPEFAAVLRCSRSIRVGVIAAIQARDLMAESDPCGRLQEMSVEAKERYPRSWAKARARLAQ